jgi:tRNA/tmRNA/rRNA uracil-C5-methylase (TrmA/RlmC/RlmD family)
MSQIDETNMGLHLVNIPYDSQLKQKQNQIENLFKENIMKLLECQIQIIIEIRFMLS